MIYLRNGGSWTTLSSSYVNDEGIWKGVSGIYVKDSGVWTEVYTSFSPTSIYGPKSFDSTRDSVSLGAVYIRVIIPGSEVTGSTTQNVVDLTDYSSYTLSNLTINGTPITFDGSNSVSVISGGGSVRSDIIDLTITSGNQLVVQFDAMENPIFTSAGYSYYEYTLQADADVPWDWRIKGSYGAVIESILGL